MRSNAESCENCNYQYTGIMPSAELLNFTTFLSILLSNLSTPIASERSSALLPPKENSSLILANYLLGRNQMKKLDLLPETQEDYVGAIPIPKPKNRNEAVQHLCTEGRGMGRIIIRCAVTIHSICGNLQNLKKNCVPYSGAWKIRCLRRPNSGELSFEGITVW